MLGRRLHYMAKKYVGKVYDGMWEVIESKQRSESSHRRKYLLRNIYNQRTVEIDERTIKRIDRGETEVCKVIRHQIFKETKYDFRTAVFQKRRISFKAFLE